MSHSSNIEPSASRASALFGRVFKGSAWVAIGFVGSQVMRLGANLILTRLLFPEAFGLMALVTVFMVGIVMFSDIGIGPSILQNKRGDEPDFLNTAWTIQVIRGFVLWGISCALAWPVSVFYNEPQLLLLLPLAGLLTIITGFEPTRVETANRHLILGRVTFLDFVSQILGILVMIGLAIAMQSVLALIFGNLATALFRLLLMHIALPGSGNSFRWEGSAAKEILHFGKWIFASTVAGFFSSQGDKAILGKFLSLPMLGIYNLGFFLASFPLQLGYAVTAKVLIPIYREYGADRSDANSERLKRMRYVLSGGLISMVLVLAFIGQPLVNFLYDDRYSTAGIILVATACIQIPLIIGLSYDQAALAAGDSKGFFVLSAVRAVVQMGFLLIGAQTNGLLGALIGLGLAAILLHPLVIWIAKRHQVWDAKHDLIFATFGLGFGALALWLNASSFSALAP